MNNFLNPLLHPERERWFRYGYTVLCIAAFGWNLYAGVKSSSVGEVWGFLSFVSLFMVVGIWSWMMSAWRADDVRIRERAMESEYDKGVDIYQDEFGVWRDSDTDEPIAAQGVDLATEPISHLSVESEEKSTWLCGKCERENALGYDDRQIPKHHRTCPKR